MAGLALGALPLDLSSADDLSPDDNEDAATDSSDGDAWEAAEAKTEADGAEQDNVE